jgi:hypothetical protein
MKINVFCDDALWTGKTFTIVMEQSTPFNPEDEKRFPPNLGKYLPDSVTSHPKSQSSSQ